MTDEKLLQDNFELLLTRQLRNATPYIDDDGFSTAVTQRLTKAKKPQGNSVWLILLAGIFGGIISVFALSAFAPAVVHWAGTLTLAAIIQLGLWGSVLIIGVFLAWFLRQLDWI
jgi:hypothetical protein